MQEASSKVSTSPKRVNIRINDDQHKIEAAQLTGRDIAELGGIPAGNQIFLEVPGSEDDIPIGPDETLELKSGMRFYDVPVGNLG